MGNTADGLCNDDADDVGRHGTMQVSSEQSWPPMASASYQAVPSAEVVDGPTAPHPSRSRKFLVCIAVCLFALGTYLIGELGAFAFFKNHYPHSTFGAEHWIPHFTALQSDLSTPPVPSPTETLAMVAHGKYSVGYFVNWGIYARKFPPTLIPVQDLTHILYAFANVRADTGDVVLSDVWADKDIHYPGDSWAEPGNNLYGNFKALHKLKKRNRHLKVLLSIGGWTYSPSFHPVVVRPVARATFVKSAVKLLEDYGLDGLDIDYEYPSNPEQAAGYRELLKELRMALDQHSRDKDIVHKFLLTIAAPCGPQNYKMLDIGGMDPYLDFWNLMAYDYSGSWDHVANHQANVHGPPINSSDAVSWYKANGVAPHKLILGIPLYGRSFMSTAGPGTPFSGLGQGSWEQGVYDYRALPLPGSYVFEDNRIVASWSYDYQRKEMISFDNEAVAAMKGRWIREQGLGGSMFWELSGDKGSRREGMEGGHGKDPVPGESLVKVVKEAMGHLDHSPNWLWYEGSQFDNLRNGSI